MFIHHIETNITGPISLGVTLNLTQNRHSMAKPEEGKNYIANLVSKTHVPYVHV